MISIEYKRTTCSHNNHTPLRSPTRTLFQTATPLFSTIFTCPFSSFSRHPLHHSSSLPLHLLCSCHALRYHTMYGAVQCSHPVRLVCPPRTTPRPSGAPSVRSTTCGDASAIGCCPLRWTMCPGLEPLFRCRPPLSICWLGLGARISHTHVADHGLYLAAGVAIRHGRESPDLHVLLACSEGLPILVADCDVSRPGMGATTRPRNALT